MAIHSNISHASMLAAIQKCYDGKVGLVDNVESLQHLGEIVTILFGPVSGTWCPLPAYSRLALRFMTRVAAGGVIAESDVDAFATALEGAYKALVATYSDFMVRDIINCWAKVRNNCLTKCQTAAADGQAIVGGCLASTAVWCHRWPLLTC